MQSFEPEPDEALEITLQDELNYIPDEGELLRPGAPPIWTNNFSEAPKFTFVEMFVSLAEQKSYNKESLGELLRAWKAIVCHVDGHVEELFFHPIEGKSCSFAKFAKPLKIRRFRMGKKYIVGRWLWIKIGAYFQDTVLLRAGEVYNYIYY